MPRDHVMCVHTTIPHQEEPPFQIRRGMTTIRPRQVDRNGDVRLYCDCVHDGPHEWPAVYKTIEAGKATPDENPLSGHGIDEGDVLI